MSGYLAWRECNMSGSLDRRECNMSGYLAWGGV